MRSLRFQPADIVINVGDTVIWTNLDSQVHDTVSGTNLVRSGYWASALMGRGQTFAVTFTNIAPGGYGYYCTPHVLTFGMRGTVTVIAPPTVTIVAPTNAAEFAIGADVSLLATATDSDGFVTQVEFFSGTNSLGIVTNPPFSVVLSNVASGNYVLTARATDNGGLVATSTPVVITVEAPPLVNLTAPLSGARFRLGSQILLGAEVFGGSAGVERVEFFADGEKLGEDFAGPYDFNWTPGNARDYELTATAADFLGQAGTSAPVAIRVFFPESTRPSVTITSAPPNFARLASPLITIAGTARDNTGVEVVEWQLNNAAFQPAAGTNHWVAQIALAAGQNTIRVRSVDFAGNVSLPATRFLTFVTNSPLTVRTNGRGRVRPDLNGKTLEIGKVYSLTARPAAGSIFAGWEGAPFQGARLNFVMRPQLALTANFLTNPFPRVQGAYAGLVRNTNGVTPESSGLVILQVGSFGAFSGRLILNGTSHSLRGQFSPTGDAKWALPRPSQVPLAIVFRVDLTNSTSSIQGTITDGRWTSEMLAYRNTFNARSNPAPQAGVRAFVFRHADNPAVQAASGTATLAAGGSASLRGSLSDGRRFSFATTMAMDGTTPFYLSLSRGTEVVAGWLRFGAGADAPVSGTPVCARTGTNGFEFDLLAIPAQY